MQFFRFVMLLSLLLFVGCEDKGALSEESLDGKTTSQSVKKTEQIYRLKSFDGKELEIVKQGDGLIFKGYEGKVVLLNFFASWCPPCKAEVPHLINLQNKYGDNFQVVAVIMEDNKKDSDVAEFAQEYGINYYIANSPTNYELAKALGGVKSIPFMILYDPNGKYHTHYMGAVPEEMIELDIKKALEKVIKAENDTTSEMTNTHV